MSWHGLGRARGERGRRRSSHLTLIGFIAGVVGARLLYAARYLSAYLADPFGLWSPDPSTLALAGCLAGSIFCWSSRFQPPRESFLKRFAATAR